MRYHQGIILFVLLTSANCVLGISAFDAVELIRLGRHAVVEALESWELISDRLPEDKLKLGDDLVFMKMLERELLKRMDQVSRKIDDYQAQMENKVDTILNEMLLQLPLQYSLDQNLKQLDHYVGQVHGLYKVFEMYATNWDKYEKFTMLQFANTCVSPRLGELPDVLKSIHRLMVPSEQQVYNRSILVLLANRMQVGSTWACENGFLRT
jgi:hypothetical protein